MGEKTQKNLAMGYSAAYPIGRGALSGSGGVGELRVGGVGDFWLEAFAGFR